MKIVGFTDRLSAQPGDTVRFMVSCELPTYQGDIVRLVHGDVGGGAGRAHHSTTGEIGGLWRSRGRPPQALTGVGFSAQGSDYSVPFKRQPGSLDPRAGFIFEGVVEDEIIGDFGLVMGDAGRSRRSAAFIFSSRMRGIVDPYGRPGLGRAERGRRLLWFKSCPRCGDGDLSSRLDFYGDLVLCLQCGHYLSDDEQVKLGVPVARLELSTEPRSRRRRESRLALRTRPRALEPSTRAGEMERTYAQKRKS